MASYGSINEIEKAIKKAVSEGLKEAGEKGKEIAKQHVDSDVYGSYAPVKYERTHTLKNTIVSENIDDMNVEIKHEGLGGYSSVVSGYSANSDLMPELVHNSGAPNIFGGNGGAWTSARPYMKNATPSVEEKAVEEIKNALTSKGFKLG